MKHLAFDGGGSGVLGVWFHLRDFERFVSEIENRLPEHVRREASFLQKYLKEERQIGEAID